MGSEYNPLYLMDHVVIHILSKTFLMVLWLKVEKLYIVKSLINILFIWKQFYQLWMSEGQNV